MLAEISNIRRGADFEEQVCICLKMRKKVGEIEDEFIWGHPGVIHQQLEM